MVSNQPSCGAPRHGVAFVFLLGLGTPMALAQCANGWLPGGGIAGVHGRVEAATVWDPDGNGPQTPRLVVGGDFDLVGTVAVDGIAQWDPATATWSALGSGLGPVRALTTLPNGDLVAGGNQVARWTGSAWQTLGGMTSAPVRSLATLPNGDLVAGGQFVVVGNVPARYVAKWNGSSWSALGSGVGDLVAACTVLANGDLVVGGAFRTAGGAPANGIARWNGTSWSGLGAGVDRDVLALATLPNGDLVAGGTFTTAGGVAASAIARWNGSAWAPLGAGLGAWNVPTVYSLCLEANGALLVGGRFGSAGNLPATSIARWSGTAWSTLGTGMGNANTDSVAALAVLPSGLVVAGGNFGRAGGVGASSLATWNGASWARLASGFDGYALGIAALPGGDLVVGGGFTAAAGVPASHVARGNGATWSAMGSIGGVVSDLLTMPDGAVVALTDPAVLRWDGANWSPLGVRVGARVLTSLPNGDLVVGGEFFGATGNCVSHWNGTTWSALGTGMSNLGSDYVAALATLPNGDVVAGGQFTHAGGVAASNVARWNGVSWAPIGAGLPFRVHCLAALPNGQILAGGGLASGLARWNGSTWSSLGLLAPVATTVDAFAVLPDGDVVAGGSFESIGGVAANRLARWDGAVWSPLGSGVDDRVQALTSLPGGGVAAVGYFAHAGGQIAVYVAHFATPCPATATVLGAACPSSGGNNTLRATSLPLVGSTLRTTGTGLPAAALVLVATGLGPQLPAVPLSALHPLALPGCNLHVVPTGVAWVLASQGIATTALPIPNSAAFAGVQLFQQMAPVEFDAGGSIVAITSTNALQLTVGVF